MKKVYYADGGTINFPNMLPEVTATGKDLRKLPKPKPKYDKRFLDWFMQQPANQREIAEIDSLNANLPAPIPTPIEFATGGQLKNAINSGFYPTNYNAPMLGFGDFLKDNAGGIGSILGGVGGLLLGNPMLGAKIGGTIGGVVEGNSKEKEAAELAQQQQIAESQKQQLLQQYGSGMMAKGGFMNSYAGGGKLDNVTNYATGGTHESNPRGGIPIGDKARVEAGEVRYNSKKFGDYIFSNRLTRE